MKGIPHKAKLRILIQAQIKGIQKMNPFIKRILTITYIMHDIPSIHK